MANEKKAGDQSADLVKKDGEVPALAADFLDSDYTGFENITADMCKTPFIKISQERTEEVKKKSAAYIEGLEPGMFFNTVTKRNYGEKIKVVVLSTFRNFIEWLPDRKGFVRSYSDGEWAKIKHKYEFSRTRKGFISADSPNVVEERQNYIVLCPDYLEDRISQLSLKGTQLKVAREWNSRAQYLKVGGKTVPFHGSVWELGLGDVPDDRGDYINITSIVKVGFSWEDEELGEMVKSFLDSARQLSRENIDYSGAADNTDEEAPF